MDTYNYTSLRNSNQITEIDYDSGFNFIFYSTFIILSETRISNTIDSLQY